MKKLLYLFLSCCSLTAYAQRSLEYTAELTGLASTEKSLPMWATTARNGIWPDSRGGLLHAGVFSDFNAAKKIQTAYGFSAAGYLTQRENKAIIDELFVSLKWRKVRLDLGMIHPEEQFNGISSQNGSVLLSTNARTLPGYNLHTEFIDVPLTKGIVAFKFNWSDYRMLDKRFVDNTNLHHKSLYLRITPHRQWEIIFGLEHWAQWAGTSPLYGKQPSGFKDYLRIFAGVSGGDDATWSDQVNVLGNHLGSRYYRLNYRNDRYTLSAYYDNLFDDDNPLKLFRNAPDGVYGFYYGAADKKRWVSDVMYEFVYTKYQSGRYHDRQATPEEIEKQDPNEAWYGHIILGGNDNYFNNGEYRSGWTYYGRTIGTPFITPCPPAADGITYGVYNNRVVAHYLGIQGYAVGKVPYRVRLSYSRNYGMYFSGFQADLGLPSGPFEHVRQQFSFGIEAGVLNRARAPFQIRVGVYGDCGSLYRDNFGITVSLIRHGKIL